MKKSAPEISTSLHGATIIPHRPLPRICAVAHLAVCFAATLCVAPLLCEPVPVRYIEGSAHAFLAVRNAQGETIAGGEFIQTVNGDRVTARISLHFRDGSIDDETIVFTQRGYFRLVSDRHIQNGPSYHHPMDMTVDASTGTVTMRSPEKEGATVLSTEHFDLPPDLANGLVFIISKDLDFKAPETRVSMMVATPKPRLIKLAITPRGTEPFSAGGLRHNAVHLALRVELGGLAGLVAPLLGMQPPDNQVWLAEGPSPIVLKEEGALYVDGPIWTIEQTTPTWAGAAR